MGVVYAALDTKLRRKVAMKVLPDSLTDNSSDEASTATALSIPGQVLGTVGYMSPEQVLGRKADERSDLFSLGVMLYEMLAARRPFEAQTPGEVMNRVVNSEPEAIARFNYEVPAPLEQILRKCLQKEPGWRYQSARELVIDLASVQRTSMSGSNVSRQVEAVSPPRRFPRRLKYAGLAVLAAVIGVTAYYWLSPKPIQRIAVIPFRNMTPNPSTDYMIEAISDSLLLDLSRMPNLQVAARSVVQRYKGTVVDPQQAGSHLDVQAVVSGTVSLLGDALSLQVELVDVGSGMQIWGQRYNRKITDLAAVQENVSQDIFDKLRLKLTEGARQRLATTRWRSTIVRTRTARCRFRW